MSTKFHKHIGSDNWPRHPVGGKNQKHNPLSDSRPATGGAVSIDKLHGSYSGCKEKGGKPNPG